MGKLFRYLAGWKPPMVFHTAGRDGKTQIWGLIHKPLNFDPHKKYPVVEDIYAGPQGSFVPKSLTTRFEPLTALGFVVVQIDGMGTNNRGKAFQDVVWKNLKDSGFKDRILWHKAAANKDFSLLEVPNGDHGVGIARAYVERKLENFFVKNMEHKQPPDWNRDPGKWFKPGQKPAPQYK
jgi:hypothetical protein